MSTSLEHSAGRELTDFDPRQTAETIAKVDALIELANKLKDWPLLERAVDAKIKEQRRFIGWWETEGPGNRHGLNRYSVDNAPAHSLSVNAAFEQTGITQPQVSRWRTHLDHEDAYRKRMLAVMRRAAGLDDPAPEPVHEVVAIPDGMFGTIVVDPPWDMQKIEREVRPNQAGFDYPTMREDDLLAWPVVRDVAADDCHLFCWTTQKWLPATLRIIEAWGFRYVLTMVWHKPGGFQPMGLPQFNCEFVVYARKGAPRFCDASDFFCCFSGRRREHSRKPDEFYDVIRRVTDGPRIDVFSRETRDGFDQYGNETGKFSS